MDFTPHDTLAEHRDAARHWARTHLRPNWLDDERLHGDHHHAELHRLLADQGLLAAGWPPEYGGSPVDVRFADAVFDEIHDFGLSSDGWITTWMVLHTLLRVGTEHQKRTVIPAALRGELIIALGYTEPASGSDMAAAQTRARRYTATADPRPADAGSADARLGDAPREDARAGTAASAPLPAAPTEAQSAGDKSAGAQSAGAQAVDGRPADARLAEARCGDVQAGDGRAAASAFAAPADARSVDAQPPAVRLAGTRSTDASSANARPASTQSGCARPGNAQAGATSAAASAAPVSAAFADARSAEAQSAEARSAEARCGDVPAGHGRAAAFASAAPAEVRSADARSTAVQPVGTQATDASPADAGPASARSGGARPGDAQAGAISAAASAAAVSAAAADAPPTDGRSADAWLGVGRSGDGRSGGDGSGGGWVIDGAKMFTSTADQATHVFLLTRTAESKHGGLTLFLVPLDAPGVEVQPVRTVGGQRTNATFYTGVRVPDEARVGEINGGWDVVRIAMVFERGTRNGNHRPGLLDRVASARPDLLSDPSAAENLARLAIDDEVAGLLTTRAEWLTRDGGLPGVEGSMAKLYTSESAQRQHATLLDLLGPDGVLDQRADDAPLVGEIEFAFRNSLVDTIYGGTSEIMREIIAAGRLGLPRSRPTT